MPNPFLEERINIDAVLLGASYTDEYNVEIVRTASDQEHRRLIHPFPVRRFRFQYIIDQATIYSAVLNLYHRAYGKFKGFRVSCIDDFSTNGQSGTPTHLDQVLQFVSTGVYQLVKTYGSTGATRLIYKPVVNTSVIGIGLMAIRSIDWSVNTTTGLISFAANRTSNIIGISKALNAIIEFDSHTFEVGQSVHISNTLGMTQINGLRAFVLSKTLTTITVGIDSTSFSTWTSNGVCNTNPQLGESVTGGCEFDIPVRFDTSIEINQSEHALRSLDGVELIELINP